MEDEFVQINFMYTDEFGQKSEIIKSFSSCIFQDQSAFEFLVGEFKLFMIAAGFSEKSVERIQIIEE